MKGRRSSSDGFGCFAFFGRQGAQHDGRAGDRRHQQPTDLGQQHFLAGNAGQLLHAVDIQGLARERATTNDQLVVGLREVGDQMTGPLIYGFSVDAVAAAKVVADFAKTNDKLVIRGGAYGGKSLDVNGVKQLASIPSKEVLLAQLCGLLKSPISRTAVVLGALAAKKGEATEAAAA